MTERKTQPLDILGPGFGRTGSHSLKLALEQLGFGPCHHMFDLREHPDQLKYWNALNAGEAVDWFEVFAGYRAQVEWPGAHYWKDLRKACPDAKVILTIRDPNEWFDSIMETIVPSMRDGRTKYADPHQRAVSRMIYKMLYQGRFDGKIEDRAHAISVFNEHYRMIVDDVPPEQLLIYEIKEGWPKLCEFLEVDIPDTPFPRSNSPAQFQQRYEERTTRVAP